MIPHDSIERYSKLGVNCFSGEAEIIDKNHIKINDKILSTKNIILATGASPNIPQIKNLEKIPYLTSDTIWNLKTLPKKLYILGGGFIACELANAFATLGSKVTIIEKGEKILANEDDEVSAFYQNYFQKIGIELIFNESIIEANLDKKGEFIILKNGGKKYIDTLLIAVGRKARLKIKGLENTKVKLGKNEYYS